MNKNKRKTSIAMIPVDRINILNPRVRNKKIFAVISDNITQVGLKRPITITACRSRIEGKDYDLVCGQGRLEAFIAGGQKEIPAMVIDASEEQALIMSLVENLARRQYRNLDLLQGIEILRKQGYDNKEIAAKTGLAAGYVGEVLNLIERGEGKLLAAVEAGNMPIRVALDIAVSPGNEQKVLQDAYESGQLRGQKLMIAKRLVENRKRDGKKLRSQRARNPRDASFSVKELLNAYKNDVGRKRLLMRKANYVGDRLLFIVEALRQLLREENFNTLLKAESLTTLPKPLMEMIETRRKSHG